MFRSFTLVFLTVVLALGGCSTPKEDSESGAGDDSGQSFDQASSCGAVLDGELRSSVEASAGIPVTIVEPPGSNQVIVQLPEGGTQLVKLGGVGEIDPRFQATARSVLQPLSFGTAYFFPAGEDCAVTVAGGGSGVIGQVFSGDGQSFTEVLVQRALGGITTDEPCASAEYTACLAALGESDTATAGSLDSFLWKPVSDSDGKLAIHTGPFNTSVIVNGELGENSGPGNGFGSLARFSRPGCGYSDPQIQVIDNGTGRRYEVGGQTTFTVPVPCNRHCLEGDAIVACTKR